MNIQNFKQATTGMLIDRPIKMRQGNHIVAVTAFEIKEDVIELVSSESEPGLTLRDIWELPEGRQLFGRIKEDVFPVFGYRVDENDIILG